MGLNTLVDFKYKKKYLAQDGQAGSGARKAGKSGEDLYIDVPQGTVVRDEETGKVIADLSEEGQVECVLKGGKGGKGNVHYATATRQIPNFAETGEPGVEKTVILELKLIADVGLLGYPNVGKSTLLSRMTTAKPKIADYHFTTIEPNLGVVKLANGSSFVMADIPGLIEGASEGVGLGLKFLRHVERTRLLIHVIDVAGTEGRNPADDFEKVNAELKKYSEKLSKRKQIIVANKCDSLQDEEAYAELEKKAKENNIEIYKISAVTGEGVNELMDYVGKLVKDLPKEEIVDIEDRVVYTLEDDKDEFTVYSPVEGEFIVEGPAVERLMGRVNIGDNESFAYLQRMIKKLGIEDELKAKGVCEGDTVKILEWEFEWYE